MPKKFTLICLILLIGILFLVNGCEQIAPVVVHNETDEILTIRINNRDIGDVEPRSSIRNELVWATAGDYEIEARNAHGNIIFSKKFSYDEIKKIDWKVVISPLQK